MDELFDQWASATTRWIGSTSACVGAFVLCLAWAAAGPIYGWSDTWQLVANTSTTVLTFLMLFLLQRSQNKDGLAIQVKLDELLRALPEAKTALAGLDQRTQDEIQAAQRTQGDVSKRSTTK